MQKYAAQILIVLLIFTFVSPIAAQTGDWNSLSSQVNKEIAVKPEKGKTIFGILTEANADSIKIKTTKDKSVSEISFKRDEVKQIWLAKLGEKTRNRLLGAGVGAGIGAGVGLGAGLIALGATGGSDEGTQIVVIAAAVGAGIGAAIGAAGGIFTGSGNKKETLIYEK